VKRKTLALLAVPVLVVGVLLVALLLNLWLRNFLRGPDFLALVSEKTSSALKVQGEYAAPTWSGFNVFFPGFRAGGIPGGPISSLEAEQIRTELLWREAFAGIWKLDGISIGRVHLILGGVDVPPPPGSALVAREARQLPAWIPKKFEPGEVHIDTARVDFGDARVQGTQATLRQAGAGWQIEAARGEFIHPQMPANTIQRASARINREGFFLTEAELLLREGGRVLLSGEVPARTRAMEWQIRWSEVPSREFVAGRQSFQLDGKFSGEAKISSSPGREPGIEGSFLLREGQLTKVPVLSLLGRFTGASRFDPLPLSELSGSFKKQPDGILVEELILESRGLLRVEGTVHIENNQTITGDLQVGVTPATLQWLPGSRERVFQQSRDGYLWTPVQVSGPADNPSEDLSARLLRAMGEEVLSGGTQIIEESADTAIEGVRGILNLLNPLGN
jgi:hypothetical protein